MTPTNAVVSSATVFPYRTAVTVHKLYSKSSSQA